MPPKEEVTPKKSKRGRSSQATTKAAARDSARQKMSDTETDHEPFTPATNSKIVPPVPHDVASSNRSLKSNGDPCKYITLPVDLYGIFQS